MQGQCFKIYQFRKKMTVTDFAVLASVGTLEELVIDSESLKSLDFLKRMPQLKRLGLLNGAFFDLSGLEALEGLEDTGYFKCL